MALFKILKGDSDRLGAAGNTTEKTKNGYAYFTPDDGKFYIDITDGEIPVVGASGQEGANRICINQKGNSYYDYDILECGDSQTVIGSNDILIFDCGTSSNK